MLVGQVKIGRRATDGRENMLSVMGPSDMFGELALFEPGTRTATVSVVTAARLATLNHAGFLPWLTSCPEFAKQVLRVLAWRFRRTNNTVADLILTDVPARVAKQLLALPERTQHPAA